MSSSSQGSESSEEEHPDDYHMIDSKTMHDIRCADDIYKFTQSDVYQSAFQYEERIQYGIKLNKKQLRQAFKYPIKKINKTEFNRLTYMARSLPKIYDMVYPAMQNKLMNLPLDFKFQYKNQDRFDEVEYWNSNGHHKQEEMEREMSSFILYEITHNGMMDSYKQHYDETEDTLDKWRVPHHQRKHFREQELLMI